jgi:hypothetical protein
VNYLPRLALNHNPPDLCLLSSWDYRHEPLVPSSPIYLDDWVFGVPLNSAPEENTTCSTSSWSWHLGSNIVFTLVVRN